MENFRHLQDVVKIFTTVCVKNRDEISMFYFKRGKIGIFTPKCFNICRDFSIITINFLSIPEAATFVCFLYTFLHEVKGEW